MTQTTAGKTKKLVDDVWMKTPCNSVEYQKNFGQMPQWIDKMADQVEISRLLDMGVFTKA